MLYCVSKYKGFVGMDYLQEKHVARSSKGGAQSAQQTHCKRGPPKRTDVVIMEQFSEME